jgi:polysaccharide biosynthesis transport protein
MKLIEFIKLVLKHKVILVMIPILTGFLAMLLTSNPKHSYYSQTMLYTGLASGSSIEMDKSFNYFATNIAFDNLLNIINSRETQEEVAVRLLSQHLLLNEPNSKFISSKTYNEIKEDIPQDIYKYVIKSNPKTDTINSYSKVESTINTIPQSVDSIAYEKTVTNLMDLMKSDNTNFVYSLLNYDHPYYSIEAISKVKAIRVSTSDLVKLSYETDDPGICQQTLAIFNEVCIKKYKDLKENGSDAVIKYFQAQLSQSESKLKDIESVLLKFNQENSIINYYEQSKAVAIVKEDMDVEYNKKRAELASSEASTKKLEQKLEIQELVQDKSNRILDNKKRLGELNYEIAMQEAKSGDSKNTQNVEALKKQASLLQDEIKSSVAQLYTYQNSVEGVPISKVLPEWVDKVVETEGLKAKIEVMNKQNTEFQQQYAKYAPAGANLKKIERQINVAEQEYLEILHGLNLAKLKYQDTQLSSNLKAVDPPYFPLKPIPSKRKIIIIAVVLMSFILLLGTVLVMKFFDDTLKNVKVAEDKLNIPAMGMFSKIFKTNNKIDLISIQERLLDLFMQNLNHNLKSADTANKTKVITIFSTQKNEGKTVIAKNIARKLKHAGKSVLVLNHSHLNKQEISSNQFTLFHRLLGYQDPRIDYNHQFLAQRSDYLNESESMSYEVDEAYFNAKTYNDLTIKGVKVPNQHPDYVIIELPNILDTNYPADLIGASNLPLLVCRSNRLWSKADENLLNNIKEIVSSSLQFIINGVELDEVEALLGELPKQRSNFRKRIKNILRFQFYTKSHI